MSNDNSSIEQELEKAVSEEEAHTNDMLAMAVGRENPLKEQLNYQDKLFSIYL